MSHCDAVKSGGNRNLDSRGVDTQIPWTVTISG